MATELIALGKTEAFSDPVTLAGGEEALVFIAADGSGSIPEGVKVDIEFQSSADNWGTVSQMRAPELVAVIVPGPCTFRVRRHRVPDQWGVSVGVDQG